MTARDSTGLTATLPQHKSLPRLFILPTEQQALVEGDGAIWAILGPSCCMTGTRVPALAELNSTWNTRKSGQDAFTALQSSLASAAFLLQFKGFSTANLPVGITGRGQGAAASDLTTAAPLSGTPPELCGGQVTQAQERHNEEIGHYWPL